MKNNITKNKEVLQDLLNPVNNIWERDFLNPVIEPFDGIRKTNARQIFGILLIIIVLDFAMNLII